MDTNMKWQELEQDTELMPHHQEVNPLALPHPEDEKVPSYQWDTEILGDQLEVEMNNILFDKSQHRVVQFHRVSTPEDYTSLVKYEERVIVSDVCKHPSALVDATRTNAEATSSSVLFLIAKNERMGRSYRWLSREENWLQHPPE